MKPLLKTSYVSMPLSVPLPWVKMFQTQADTLGISRNAAICLALKYGGPILAKYVDVMRDGLHAELERISTVGKSETYKILGTAPAPAPAVSKVHERRKDTEAGNGS